MNNILSYQFVGRSDGLHKLPDHIQQIKNKLGYDDLEKQIVEGLIPSIKKRARAQSIPDKPIPKHLQINNLQKKLATLKQEYDKLNQVLQRHQSFRSNIKSPKTLFEQHFSSKEHQIQQMEEQRQNIASNIKQTKKELFYLENQSDTYSVKKVVTNNSIFLSDLVVIERKQQVSNQNDQSLGYQTNYLPKLGNPFESKATMISEHKGINTQSNLIDILESDDEVDLRPKTRNQKFPTLEQIVDQLDSLITKPSERLLPSKVVLVNFRRAKYEKYYSKQKYSHKRKRSLRSISCLVFFCICILRATQISQYRYQLISQQYQKINYQRANSEILFFVNNIVGKQILFKISRLQQLQKTDRKALKSLYPITAQEIVKEILQKVATQKFSNQFYSFIFSVSSEGYHPLQNYNCDYIKSKMNISKLFKYLLSDVRKMFFFEFVILKSILFYGLFFRAKELFTQLKIDLESELLMIVAVTMIELFLRTQKQSVLNINLKLFTNQSTDGQYILQVMKDMDQIKSKLINYIQFDELIGYYNQMIEKQHLF
ncbi:hypothetical protein pb186bvf_011385 [Paramecium bursaria]